MSLAVVNEISGEKYTKLVMLDLEYDPQPPVKGGSEQNTDKGIVENVRAMYDGAIQPVLHPKNGFAKLTIDNKKDPVCGMPLSAGFADTINYKGKSYGFCSTTCKNKFKEDPASCLITK